MRNRKALIAVALVCVICLSLCACSLEKSDVVGTWSGGYIYNGSAFGCAFVLDSDGTYAKVVYKDGSLSSTEVGTYEIDGRSVALHKDGNTGISTVYDYKNGKLVNNGHEFTRE